MQNSKTKDYFNPGVTVDVAIFTIEDGSLKILLIKRANEPFKNKLALPGGFIHEDETAHDTALRVLADKAGVAGVYIEQLYTFDAPNRDPRGQIMSVTYFALVPREKINIEEGRQTEQPKFIDVEKIAALSFDHSEILAYARKRLQDKIQYTNVIYSLLPKLFTLSQLQSTYEIILDKKIDKRNFRKKFLQLGLLEATEKKFSEGRQRPAVLYRFKKTGFAELKKFF